MNKHFSIQPIMSKPKKLAEVFSSTDEQIQKMNGFDHPFILTNHDLINPDVILKSPTKDITLEMFTDQPSVVIFSANFADNGPDIQGKKLVNHGALNQAYLRTKKDKNG